MAYEIAAHAGFCMGVSLALQKLNTALERKGGTPEATGVCTLGPIIHNPQVLAEYESRGGVCVKEAAQLHPGDVVNIAPGVKHWHGAAPDNWFSHLAVEVPGEETYTEWCESVGGEDYAKLK